MKMGSVDPGILSGIMFCLGFSIGAFTVAILAICERH